MSIHPDHTFFLLIAFLSSPCVARGCAEAYVTLELVECVDTDTDSDEVGADG